MGMNFIGNSYMDWEKKGKGFFRLSGQEDWGYDFLLIRAVAQSGSALPWGGRGPGFKSRRPDVNFGNLTGFIGHSY